MKNKISIKRFAVIFMLAAIVAAALTGCGNKSEDVITSIDQLERPGTEIGVAFDLLEYDMLKRDYPNAKIKPYTDNHLAYEDVANGRLDAYIYARLEMTIAIENGISGVHLLDENYSSNTVVVGISPQSKIPDLQKEINAFISELRENGTLDDMFNRWVILKENKMPEIKSPDEPKYHLRVGTTGTVMPFSYFVGTELYGYDIELAYRFAAWLGADVEFKIYDFGGTVTAAVSGDIDCIMSDLYITPEIAESIPCSDPLFNVEMTAMVRDGSTAVKALTLDDLTYADIGVMTGTNFNDHIQNSLPKANIMYFNTTADELNALKSGKISAFALDEPVARTIMAQDKTVTLIPEQVAHLDYGFIFEKSEKGAALRDELNKFILKIKDDGTMAKLQDKWFDSADISLLDMPDYRKLNGNKGTIKLATIQNPPFSFTKDDISCGYDIELFYMFCVENGYSLNVIDVNMDALLSSVQSGKFDTACCGISITEERKESMLFSEPNYSGGTVLMVLNTAREQKVNFWDTVCNSFEKTFIRENRWKLFLEGIGTTLLITVLSIIFGTLLGFLTFMLCRSGNPVADKITRFCVWLVKGMPVVVLLMILYYIIFGKVAISGTIVSIVGFTLIFAAAVLGMLKSGVSAVDRGQTEAAYALGYTDRKTFYRIILPQALPHFLPAYKSEITALIKATSIVGYVAVQDLTKMGDIVRSRTFEAFFPLIAVAVFYFVLAAILTLIVNKIVIHIDPRRRSRKDILKGVNEK